MRRKTPFTIFKYLFSFQRYSSFWKMQISQVMTSYTQLNFDQMWWRKITQPICIRNVWFFCSKILLKMLHSTSLKVLLPYQHTGFQTSQISKAFLAAFGVPFFIFANGTSYAWSSRHINMLPWFCFPLVAFFELKITDILKSSGWGLEKSELP